MKKKAPMKKASSMEVKNVDTMVAKETKMDKNCKCASNATDCAGWGLLALRVVVGFIFVVAGWPKIMAAPQFFGLPGFVGSLVGIVEVLGGIAMIVGFWTRWAGYLLAAIMVVAILFVKKFAYPAIQVDLLLLAGSFAIAWAGPGRWSAHSNCGCCDDRCNC